MTVYRLGWKSATKNVTLVASGSAVPGGYTDLGVFTWSPYINTDGYDKNITLYNIIRDILYKQNVQDMHAVTITNTISNDIPLGPEEAGVAFGMPSGTLIYTPTGLDAGETLVAVSPNDGRYAIAGAGTTLVTGLTASTVGTNEVKLTTSTGRVLRTKVVVSYNGSLASYTPPVGVYNFAANRLTKLINDIKAVKAGTGNAIIIVEGDSNVWGEGAGDSGTNNRVNAKERCWPTILAKRLAAAGINTCYESLYASGGNVTVTTRADYLNVYKAGFSYTGTGWDFVGATSLGGLMWQNTTDATSELVIVTQQAVDTIELMYPTVSGNGILVYNIDGGADIQLSQNGTTANTRTQISLGSVGIHTIKIKRLSGTVFFTGYRAWNSTIKQVQVINVGRSSSTTADWNVFGSPYAARNALQDLSSIASCVFLCSTINDGLANMADATYNANYQALDTAAAAGGASVIYGTGIPSNIAQVTQVIQDRIRNDLKALAVSNNRVMFDWPARNGDWVTMNAAGLIFNQNHPNLAGYLDWGNFVADQLIGALSA